MIKIIIILTDLLTLIEFVFRMKNLTEIVTTFLKTATKPLPGFPQIHVILQLKQSNWTKIDKTPKSWLKQLTDTLSRVVQGVQSKYCSALLRTDNEQVSDF